MSKWGLLIRDGNDYRKTTPVVAGVNHVGFQNRKRLVTEVSVNVPVVKLVEVPVL